MKKIIFFITGFFFLAGCIHHPRYSELLKENEQLKQEVEKLKIQLGKEVEMASFQAAEASYRARTAETQRNYCDSLLKAINKKN